MAKIINLGVLSKKEEKLQKIANNLKELKNAYSDVIDEYEAANAGDAQLNLLEEALDAMEDAYSILYDVIVDGMLETEDGLDDF